jgi:DNA (cytosine-5)-methyltransferase 1
MTHASLFSGIGGFDYASALLGWINIFDCEIDAFCRKVLEYHFPNSVHYGDITKQIFKEWRGKIDVLSGGFPCQPFSLAGQRKGADDNRYLWPQMLRVIREIRPTWVVGENVAGILTMVQPGAEVEVGGQASLFGEDYRKRVLHRQEYVIETICRDLEREGYAVQPLLIPACAVGAPHRRDRIWFIAHRTNAGTETMQFTGENGIYAVGTSSHTDGDRYKSCGTSCRIEKERRQGERIYGKHSETKKESFNKQSFGCIRTTWQNFPTQSPICIGDDGISGRLDGITFSKWRQESVKAYGNAIVPQVAYEIFKAIELCR